MKVRSVFISDVHLGLRKSKTAELLAFFDRYDADYYFLIGDIIDLWKLRSSLTWTKGHNQVMHRLVKLARRKKVVFIPGNHDEYFRDFTGTNVAGIDIEAEFVHTTKDGTSLLLIHGDQFDKIVLHNKWLAVLGSWMYDVLLELNEVNNWLRRILRLKPWSLSMYLKHKAKEATNMMEGFRDAAIEYATHKGCDMVITGHIHKPELTSLYGNCGDWIENCSAIIEEKDGMLRVVRMHQ
jgi:UDP-2,3-diacylglucosamine pyrophosphatase LpxH